MGRMLRYFEIIAYNFTVTENTRNVLVLYIKRNFIFTQMYFQIEINGSHSEGSVQKTFEVSLGEECLVYMLLKIS